MADSLKSLELAVVQNIPRKHAPKFANHFVVHRPNAHEVHLLFYVLKDPILGGTPKEIETALSSIGEMEAECVAEIVIPASRFEELNDLIAVPALEGTIVLDDDELLRYADENPVPHRWYEEDPVPPPRD